MPRRLPNISKIQQLIGYQPTRNLLEMLGAVIAYERIKLEAKVKEKMLAA